MKRRRAKFGWDNQNLPKIAAHGLSKFEVEFAVTDGLLQELDTKMVKAELRRVAVGRILQWPAGDRRIDGVRQTRIRVVTAYRMNREERERIMASRKNPLVKKVSKGKGRTVVELNVPAFQSEDEEGAWWEANRSDVIGMVMRYGKRAPTAKTRPITLRLPESDLVIAKDIAAQHGLPYQTFVKRLVHDGLEREANSQAAVSRKGRPALGAYAGARKRG